MRLAAHVQESCRHSRAQTAVALFTTLSGSTAFLYTRQHGSSVPHPTAQLATSGARPRPTASQPSSGSH